MLREAVLLDVLLTFAQESTLCAECFATQVTLERLLSCVCSEMHVEIGFLRKGVVAEFTHKWSLIPKKVHSGTNQYAYFQLLADKYFSYCCAV